MNLRWRDRALKPLWWRQVLKLLTERFQSENPPIDSLEIAHFENFFRFFFLVFWALTGAPKKTQPNIAFWRILCFSLPLERIKESMFPRRAARRHAGLTQRRPHLVPLSVSLHSLVFWYLSFPYWLLGFLLPCLTCLDKRNVFAAKSFSWNRGNILTFGRKPPFFGLLFLRRPDTGKQSILQPAWNFAKATTYISSLSNSVFPLRNFSFVHHELIFQSLHFTAVGVVSIQAKYTGPEWRLRHAATAVQTVGQPVPVDAVAVHAVAYHTGEAAPVATGRHGAAQIPEAWSWKLARIRLAQEGGSCLQAPEQCQCSCSSQVYIQ